jgi:hypothetical protein
VVLFRRVVLAATNCACRQAAAGMVARDARAVGPPPTTSSAQAGTAEEEALNMVRTGGQMSVHLGPAGFVCSRSGSGVSLASIRFGSLKLGADASEPRQVNLLDLVGDVGPISLETLAERFGVTLQTVRRDVAALARAGLLLRFHGGVVHARPRHRRRGDAGLHPPVPARHRPDRDLRHRGRRALRGRRPAAGRHPMTRAPGKLPADAALPSRCKERP